MSNPKAKICTKCRRELPASDFQARQNSSDGLQYNCCPCRTERAKEWRHENPERQRANDKRSRERNRAKRSAQHKRWRESNRERVAQLRRKADARYPEKKSARKAVINAVARGKLVKPERCEGCKEVVISTFDLHGHHKDYAKKLDVEWLCRRCHWEAHRPEVVA